MSGLEEKLSAAGRSRPAVIGFPIDCYSSYMKGAASAPPLIRKAFYSPSSNLWSEAGADLGGESAIFDAGDLELLSAHDTEGTGQTPVPDEEGTGRAPVLDEEGTARTTMAECRDTEQTSMIEAGGTARAPSEGAFGKIERTIALLLERDLPPISLGGDHSITYPIVKAINKKHGELHILHFDAHPDLYSEFQGSPCSHACSFARIMENGLAGRIVQVGIRAMNGHQRHQAERFGAEVIEMKDWRDGIELEFDKPLYISFDVDALDPAFAPGVSHYEPGGFTTRQVLRIIQEVSAPAVVGADIVEYNPVKDLHGVTAMVCAKIMKELAARMLV